MLVKVQEKSQWCHIKKNRWSILFAHQRWIESPFYYLLEVVPSSSSDMTYEDLQSVVQINIIEGGKTPILSPVELGKIGYSLIVYSVSLLGVSMRAMKVSMWPYFFIYQYYHGWITCKFNLFVHKVHSISCSQVLLLAFH